MGNGFQFFDIIIFAAIAAFLVLRLRSVLGKRTGHNQRREQDPFRQDQPEESAKESGKEKVIQLPDRGGKPGEEGPGVDAEAAGEQSPLEAGLTQIALADRSFEPEQFVGGAKAAFETIIAAFAQGDARALRPLLSNDVYEDFTSAIKARAEVSRRLETTLVGISEAEIIEAELQSKTAFVTVKFVTEQINVTRDADDKVVEGEENQVTKITDLWTFARNTRSRDPNWTLVATRSPN